MRALIVGLLSVALLSSCTSFRNVFRGKDSPEPPKVLADLNATVGFEKVWSQSVGKGPVKSGARLTPAYANGRAFIADADGAVAAFDIDSGRQLWEIELEDQRLSGGPGAGAGAVVVGTLDGALIALNPETGAELWRARASSEVITAPAVSIARVIVRANDGSVTSFKIDNGEREWVYAKSLPLLTLRGNSSPLLLGGKVIMGSDNGRVVALDESNGQQVWEQSLADADGRTELERLTDIDGTLIADNNELFAVAYNGRAAQLDLETGRTLWTRDLSSYAGVGVSAEQVIVSDEDSSVTALDRRTGASLWKQDAFERRAVTSAAEVDGVVVVGDFEGYLLALSADGGKEVGRVKQGGNGFAAAPVAVGKMILAFDRSGTLTAWRLTGA
jgi:outer membrane protein assembly factor BamB